MKTLCTLALLSLFSFSAFSSTCYVLGKASPQADEYDVVLATIENAFENPEKSRLVVVKKDGGVITDLTKMLEGISTEEDYLRVVSEIDGGKAMSFTLEEDGSVVLFSGSIDASLGGTEEGMFVARSVARGSVSPHLVLVDYGSGLASMCQ